MELRRIGTAAFRSSTRDLPFLQLLQPNKQTVIRTPIAHRALSTTSRTYASDPEPTIRASFTPDFSSSSSSPSNGETPNAPPASPPSPKEDTLESLTQSISEALPWITPKPQAEPSHLNRPIAQGENQSTFPRTSQSPPLKSSNLLNRISNPHMANPSSNFARSPSMDSPFGRMQVPIKKTGATSSLYDFMNVTASMVAPPLVPRKEMRLSPRTGRTIDIKSNIDLSRGIRMLEASCALNKVRHDHTHQRFHERGGMKRKRLHRQRWRNNFMEGFKGIIGRVKQLKNQGW
ncbi:539a054f-c4a9-4a01-98ac-8fdfce71d61f [Sclerotinia trifoliorum]|uniref:539a054f-c4a9-4a01-98ac-8fdfce71d61f n=1 Tax=Sclerotinia trifoliorum TaxID=28548 RepID=A0A8H2W680_9HELO|nr:539a054f-c4a9-4a01-98ac-8fdfce71d61f [Sclerotinia trifoliorum]